MARTIKNTARKEKTTPSTVSSAAVSLPVDVASDTDEETTVATPDKPSTPMSRTHADRHDTTRAPSTTESFSVSSE